LAIDAGAVGQCHAERTGEDAAVERARVGLVPPRPDNPAALAPLELLPDAVQLVAHRLEVLVPMLRVLFQRAVDDADDLRIETAPMYAIEVSSRPSRCRRLLHPSQPIGASMPLPTPSGVGTEEIGMASRDAAAKVVTVPATIEWKQPDLPRDDVEIAMQRASTDLPAELADLLWTDKRARAAWALLTVSQQRMLREEIARAKPC
jgi:hypothetical protein